MEPLRHAQSSIPTTRMFACARRSFARRLRWRKIVSSLAGMLMRFIMRSLADPNVMTEKMNEFRGSLGSMRLRHGKLQLFHKRLPLACFVAASPAPHAKFHRDARTLCR